MGEKEREGGVERRGRQRGKELQRSLTISGRRT